MVYPYSTDSLGVLYLVLAVTPRHVWNHRLRLHCRQQPQGLPPMAAPLADGHGAVVGHRHRLDPARGGKGSRGSCLTGTTMLVADYRYLVVTTLKMTTINQQKCPNPGLTVRMMMMMERKF